MRLATCIIVLRNVRQYQLYDSNEDPGCTAAPFVEMYAKIYARREVFRWFIFFHLMDPLNGLEIYR